jgi:hypothetical protein
VAEGQSLEVRLAGGTVEVADSLWCARHLIARAVAFDTDPTRPWNVLPAEIWRRDTSLFGGRAFVETISTVAELSSIDEPGQ